MLSIVSMLRFRCYILFSVMLFSASCGSHAIDGKSKRIGDVLFVEPNSGLVNDLALVEHNKGFWSGMYWYKGTVAPEWFRSQIDRLEDSGYAEFKESENLDLQAKVFSEHEWSKPHWHSVARIADNRRYSIYYQEETKTLTLIWFSY